MPSLKEDCAALLEEARLAYEADQSPWTWHFRGRRRMQRIQTTRRRSRTGIHVTGPVTFGTGGKYRIKAGGKERQIAVLEFTQSTIRKQDHTRRRAFEKHLGVCPDTSFDLVFPG